MIRLVALLLTLMTGFSGLVYEVTWQKYLATLLGSHSEATASVLGIFLGGLSVGYWLFGQVTRRHVARAETAGSPPRLLLLYGVIEASIGVYVIAFPWLFEATRTLSYALPHGTGGAGFAIDVALATGLIGPASVLMGGTIPILTQGLSRSLDDATRFHAFVYAFNTAGAFAGALAAGFVLIPWLGLVRVMFAMGCINLAAGGIFILLGLRGGQVVSLSNESADNGAKLQGFADYAGVALLTGFAMMTVQTAAIRIAGLSFGSSQFTFSMVVAVFVLCIALGSFAVSALSRIPKWLVVANQWLLAVLFLLLYPRLDEAPHWIWRLRLLFQSTEEAFTVYYLAGFMLVLLVLGLPILLSGASLPLLFHQMRRQADHLGDLAGSLYSWNTVGSLLGALLGGYALFFWLDLNQVFLVAVAALLLSAVLLSVRVYGLDRKVTVVALPIAAVLFLLPAWDEGVLQAGLFRRRDPLPFANDGIEKIRASQKQWFADNIVFQEDDPIASITVRRWEHPGYESYSISTNGKSDSDTHVDYPTMGLAATLPTLLADDARKAFVVGWGTGITVGELASFDSIEQVDVAEISPGVMNAASFFAEFNMDAAANPKVHVIESDAYRALMRSDDSYDVIVSEPSNPWVAGVEMLYSREFLKAAKSKLAPGGVFCQWIHQYEIDSATVELVLRTYRDVFDHVAIWRTNRVDLLLLGFNSEGPARDHYRLEARAAQPDFKASLSRAGVSSFAELLAHEVVPVGVTHAIDLEGPIHTLYHPILADMAGRAFFKGSLGELPFTGHGKAAEVGHKNSMAAAHFGRFSGGLPEDVMIDFVRESCVVNGPRCRILLRHWVETHPDMEALRLTEAELTDADWGRSIDELTLAATLYGGGASIAASDPIRVGEALSLTDDYIRSYSHAVPYRPLALESAWATCREKPPSRSECQRQVDARAAQESTDAGLSQEQLEAEVDRCLSRTSISRQCEEGAQQTRSLLETGETPPLLEAWRHKRAQSKAQGT